MAEKPFPAYEGDEPYFFVSYAHDEASVVYPEMAWIRGAGFNLWYDDGIHVGTVWRRALADAVAGASGLVFFCTEQSVASENCLKEINFALDEEKPVFVIQLDDAPLPRELRLSLSDRQALVRSEFDEDTYRSRLIAALGTVIEPRTGTVNEPSAVPRPTARPRRLPAKTLAAVTVALVAAFAIYQFVAPSQPDPTENREAPGEVSERAAEPDTAPAIAVLPFVNMSSDPEQDYFSDGISEEILNSLVRTNTIPVIARTSSFQFKGKDLGVQDIASELNVTYVLEGSVRKVGNEVRITAQLIDADTEVDLWSETYTRELINIFALQDEIAAAVVEGIQARVGIEPKGREPSLRTRVVDEAAYDLYLKAQKQAQLQGPSQRAAIELYRQAVELDPEFADAWAGLGGAYVLLFTVDGAIPREVAPLAKTALQRALDIEPDHAMALSMLGFIRAHIDYEWAQGSALMKRAVQLSPQEAEIQMLYALHLGVTVQPGTMEVIEKAYRLDPLSPGPAFFYALTLGKFGRVVDAERVMASFLVTAAEQTDLEAATIYLQTQNFDLVEQHLEKAKAVWGADHWRVLTNEYQLARARGDDALASSIEQGLLRRMENESVQYDGFGSADSLKRRYQLAYRQRQFLFVGGVLRDKPPQFTDEEWQDLREKMNIAELGDTALPTLRTRTEAEAHAVIARRIELDPAVIDNYVGVYEADGSVVEFSRRGTELWIEVPQLRYQGRTIAIAEDQFELLGVKGYQYRFMEPGAREYDLEITNGQIVSHFRRTDK